MEHLERLKKIRFLLMAKSDTAFFVALAYKISVKVTEEVSTACVSAKEMWFNPQFMDSLNDEELLFLYLHELMHLILLHSDRVGHREPKLWNSAGDYVINLALVNKGYKMPKSGLLDYQFAGLTTEEVYDFIATDSPNTQCPMLDIVYGAGTGEGEEEGSPNKLDTCGDIKEIFAEAVQMASIAGETPSDICPDIARMIKEVFSTQVDWRSKLQKKVTGALKRKTDWLRPNRRYSPYYLPRNKRTGVDIVTILIDVSGSVSVEELTTYVGEILFILKSAKPVKVEMLFFSVGITDSHVVRSISDVKDILTKPIKSNGGTSLIIAMEELKDHKSDLVVIFSDGHFALPPIDLFNPKTQYIGCFTTDVLTTLGRRLPWEIVEIQVQK